MKENRNGVRMLVAGSILQLFLGIIYVWSVFVAPVSKHLSWDLPAVKLTSSFMLGFFVLGILFGGKLQAKTGTSPIVLVGGLLMAVGMLITSFIPVSTPWIVYISYGVLGGFGVGMAYNAIITAAQKWFPTKRGLATGISVCMFGFSTVVFAPLVELLVNEFALVNTFRILAVAFGVVTLILFKFINLPSEQDIPAGSNPLMENKQYTTSETIRSKSFYFITLSMMFLTAAYFILNPSFKELAGQRNISDGVATILVMITGIASATGRLVVPLLAGKIGREKAIGSIIIATAISTALLTFATGALLIVAIAIIAFCYGGSSGAYPLITADYFGMKHLGSNYGAIMMGFALSALTFPAIFGLINDQVVKFIALAVVALLGAVMILLLSLTKNKKSEV